MNKSKIKICRKKDLSSLEKLKSWLDSHKIIGFFLILGLILGIGLGVNLFFLNSFLFRRHTEISTIVFQYI